MDIVRCLDKLDVVVIGSSSTELVPLVQYIVERGIKCHVVACGIPKELRAIATEFVEIPAELFNSYEKPAS